MPSPNFDRLIDDVARRMTAGDPPAALRARVMSRVEERRRPMRRSWLIPVAAILTIGAIAVAATVAVRSGHVPTTTADLKVRPAATLSATSATTPAETAIPSKQAGRTSAHRVIQNRRASASSQPTAEELAWRARAIPALDPIDPLKVERIQPSALAIPLLQIAPLTTPPVTISGVDNSGK